MPCPIFAYTFLDFATGISQNAAQAAPKAWSHGSGQRVICFWHKWLGIVDPPFGEPNHPRDVPDFARHNPVGSIRSHWKMFCKCEAGGALLVSSFGGLCRQSKQTPMVQLNVELAAHEGTRPMAESAFFNRPLNPKIFCIVPGLVLGMRKIAKYREASLGAWHPKPHGT